MDLTVLLLETELLQLMLIWWHVSIKFIRLFLKFSFLIFWLKRLPFQISTSLEISFPSTDIWRWPVRNLVTLIHGYSYLISLEIVVSYRKLRSFQRAQVNLSMLLEKPDITYLLRNS